MNEILVNDTDILFNMAVNWSSHDLDNLKRIVDRYNRDTSNLELEMRFGIFGDKFYPGISENDFNRLLDFHARKFNPNVQCDTMKIYSGNMRYNEENNVTIKKDTLEKLDLNEYDVRISLAREIMQKQPKPNDQIIHMIRSRTRYSFQVSEWLRVDLTKIKSTTSTDVNSQNDWDTTFELEFEIVKPTTVSLLLTDLKSACQYLRDSWFIPTRSELTEARMKLTKLLSLKQNVEQWAGVQPKTLQWNDMNNFSNETYGIAEKPDGDRCYLFITLSGMVFIFSNRNPGKFRQIAYINSPQFDGTLLDGELVNDKFYAFDAICWKGKDLRGDVYEDLKNRLEYVRALRRDALKTIIEVKTFKFGYGRKEICEIADGILSNRSNMPYEIDGLIFVSVCEPYPKRRSGQTFFKWKFINTIDFRLVQGELWVNHDQMEIPFRPVQYPQIHRIECKENYEEGQIAECAWNFTTQQFEVFRIRADKKKPNFIHIALHNLNAIIDPIPWEYFRTGDERVLNNRPQINVCGYYVSQNELDIIKSGNYKPEEHGIKPYVWQPIEQSNPIVVTDHLATLKAILDRAKKVNPPENGAATVQLSLAETLSRSAANLHQTVERVMKEKESDVVVEKIEEIDPEPTVEPIQEKEIDFTLNGKSLKKLKLQQLRDYCVENGLKKTGNKTELSTRIQQFLKQKDDDDENMVEETS